jgi:hypothetical protein
MLRRKTELATPTRGSSDERTMALSAVLDRCPAHRSPDLLLKCPTCARRLWEHIDAIVKKFPDADSSRVRGY